MKKNWRQHAYWLKRRNWNNHSSQIWAMRYVLRLIQSLALPIYWHWKMDWVPQNAKSTSVLLTRTVSCYSNWLMISWNFPVSNQDICLSHSRDARWESWLTISIWHIRFWLLHIWNSWKKWMIHLWKSMWTESAWYKSWQTFWIMPVSLRKPDISN